MVTKTKKAPAKKAPASKGKAPKANADNVKAEAPQKLIEPGTFAKFNGYGPEVDDDERVFAEGDTVYIIEHDDSGETVMYSAIPADQVEEYLNNGDQNVTGGQVGPREVSPLKGTALETARDSFMPVKAIGKLSEMLEAANNDAVEVARELFGEVQESYFWLGGALAQVLHEGSYLAENGGEYEGEEAFNDFCQAEFGFKASKGRQLARIYKTFSQIPDFDPEKLAGIGWSIANKIEKYVTSENVDEVIDTVTGVPQAQVDATMQEKFVDEKGLTPSGRPATRGSGGGAASGGAQMKLTSRTFRFAEDTAETIDLALKACMQQSGIKDENLALERICTEWAQEHVESSTAKKRIESKASKAAKAREKETAPKATKKPATKAAPARKRKVAATEAEPAE